MRFSERAKITRFHNIRKIEQAAEAGKEKIMARRKFAKLKALMYEQGVTQLDVASKIGRGPSYVAKRMNALASFTLADMCTIGTMLGIPREDLLLYFLDGQ